MIVLGIDPGSRITGFGVIDAEPGGESLVEFGVVRLDEKDDHVLRLLHIHQRLLEVIERCRPDACAIEMPIYAQNAQSMLKLGRAQAAAMLAALSREIPVVEYTPKEVKKSVTGNGAATKDQVGYMVRTILSMTDAGLVLPPDAADALAVSLCHAHRVKNPGSGGRGSWTQFIRDNPDRVR